MNVFAMMLVLWLASTAHADERLSVEAPPGCMRSEELARRVRETPLDGQVRVQIDGEPELGWQAWLRSYDGDRMRGERRLSAPPGDCTQLDDGIALVVNTFLGALPPPVARVPWRWRGSLAAALGRGPLPAPFFGLASALDVSRGHFALRAGLLALPRASVDLGEGARGDFAALLVRLGICGLAVENARHRLDVCAGARVGPLFARTRGLATTARTTTVSAELELGARYTYRLAARWGIYLGATATLPLVTSTYQVSERGDRERAYHQTDPGVTGELGGMFAFAL